MGFCNLHNHSTFSDGRCSPEESVLAAIDRGMVSIGFSDHSYLSWGTGYCMAVEDIPRYKAAVRALQQKYAGRMEVCLGLELDGNSVITDREDYDYIIGDLHDVMVEGQPYAVDSSAVIMQQAIDRGFGGDPAAYAAAYFDRYVECITQMRPDILGHFDLVNKFSLMPQEDPRYIRAARDALAASLEVTPLIELNTGALSRGHRAVYPGEFLLRDVLQLGGRVILTADSHHTDHLTYAFDTASALLTAHGFRTMTVYQGGGFREVPLE